ncbi:MAG: glycosyltransferase family 2 protein [Candidatus Promineifilaceae bacterium]|nr:glycosyltransferase family 2 protein [Candidatus Promineifilaceae bacterium]
MELVQEKMSLRSPEPHAGRVLVVIPAYNEAAAVGQVVASVRAQGLPALVVDDGSTDRTAAEAAEAGAIIIRLGRNSGKGAALQAGFRYALDEAYDAVITLDADGQHDPAEIPRFLDAFWSRTDDLIIGARNFDDMPWTRYTMNILGRWTFSWVVGETMLDNQSGYRMVSRRLVAASLRSPESGYEFEVDMIIICLEEDLSLGWVPIRTIYNEHPSHINHVKHVLQYLRLLMQIRRRLKAHAERRDKEAIAERSC